ncbi:hypothetical protein F4677DRAFT_428910 [Hypoxylon crocopeplum]|nr:hypothetical protein F4677DRAFT_428910 [Hypoxylon crocopeplum]
MKYQFVVTCKHFFKLSVNNYFRLSPTIRSMTNPEQKHQTKAGKSFDTGSTNALPSVDLASGIFEAPSAVQPEAQPAKPVSTGGPLDKQAATGSPTGGTQKSEGEMQEVVNSDGSISRKPKDTAGAGAMIL